MTSSASGHRKKTRFVSDLHMFARRSSADVMQRAIEAAVSDSNAFILGGDIFDFRWSRWSSHKQTAEQSMQWLRDLVSINPECQIHYILGNHDANPEFLDRLHVFTRGVGNLEVHPHLLRLDDCVFLHGDIIDAPILFEHDFHEQLNVLRQKEEERRRPPEIQHALYDAVVSTGLHRWIAHVANGNQRVLDRVTRYLDWAGHGPSAGIRNVYFGHTHRPLDRVPYSGMVFSNPGASIKGMDCRILSIERSAAPLPATSQETSN
jgi:UDP-2,3-diacylglucosamine hydrolase